MQIVDRPIRVAVAGAGAMGMAWLRAIQSHPDCDLAGIVDIDQRRAIGAAIRIRRKDLPTAAAIEGLAAHVDVCVNVTPPDHHHEVIAAALDAGLCVLTEKPFAATMAQALELTRLAAARDRLLMVAQTRRYDAGLVELARLAGQLGQLSMVTTEFRQSHPASGFRQGMRHPLLLDMAVHAFDAARFLIGSRPLTVCATEFNPAHSWFAQGAAAVATVTFDGGVSYSYTGSWCARGALTSWAGRWRVDGELGSCAWTGDTEPDCTLADPSRPQPRVAAPGPVTDLVTQVSGPLDDFVAALRTGARPWGEAADNLLTLAIVQAAISSAARSLPVAIEEMLEPPAEAV